MPAVDQAPIGGPEAPHHGVPAQRMPTVLPPSEPMATWLLDPDHLTELADTWSAAYRAATPFPHVVLDNVLPDALLHDLVANFPSVDDPGWKVHDETVQRKQQWHDASRLPAAAASVVALLQAAPFLTFLERLTGIDGLIGDPHCHHGGLHQTLPGGFLKVHTDAPTQPALCLQRRVNMIVFLNPDWSPAWGGDLELWDTAMTGCGERIAPRFNRIVVFDALGSNHGHPDPITPPPGVLRRSLALYYYLSPAHPSALPASAAPPRTFVARPGEVVPQPPPPQRSRVRAVAREVLPPVVARMLRRTRRRLH